MDSLIGIDVGTSSVKVVAVDVHGKILREAQKSYSLAHPIAGWAEVDPQQWWSQTDTALRGLIQELSDDYHSLRVLGVGLTGQMHSLVLIDGEGNAVRPAITWLDTRARSVMSLVTETLSRAGMLERIKNNPAPGLTIAILAWLVVHEPESISRAQTMLLAKDYIRFRLTGEIASDYTDASSTLLFDVEERNWFFDAAKLIGVPTRLFPPLRETWEPGEPIPAEAIGLPKSHHDVPLATGCSDQQAAALANGVIAPGTMQLMLGTGAQVVAPVDSTAVDSISMLNFFAHHRNWIVQGSVQNAGSSLAWGMKVLGANWSDVSNAVSEPIHRNAPFFLPYLSGERTPIMDPNATGGWLGLRNSLDRSDLIRSCLEGVVFGIADAVEAVIDALKLDKTVDLRVSGGGIQLLPYVQMISDALNRTLTVLPEANTTGIGAAILGGMGAQIFTTLEEGNAVLGTQADRVVVPNKASYDMLTERRAKLKPLRDSYLDSSGGLF